MSELVDINVLCVGCNNEFAWTAGEQRFLNTLMAEGKIQKVNQPKRCIDCRAIAKKRRDEGQSDF